ncbi:uncharacterized protein LOC18011992 [Eutrema salsugineum]|uniref:uncharacterized protein LOC18011992 n=1 Tax=Eutrema salsugineum TaxID=72664 RepID=UPI000CED1B7C|nr:uncharacterized protein LOC18011992 [Eutrema salsugineum]
MICCVKRRSYHTHSSCCFAVLNFYTFLSLYIHISVFIIVLLKIILKKKKGGFSSLYRFHHMEDPKENKNAPWLSVPQFGDWDQKGGTIPDYSMDFSKIREMRKQNKRDPSRASLGNEEDLINPFHNQPTSSDTTKAKLTTVHSDNNNNSNHNGFSHHHPHSPSTRRGIFSCFNCCVKA